MDAISHWIYIDLRNNKNGLQKGKFSFKDGQLSWLCAMSQGKNVQKLRTVFQAIMKTTIVFINVNKNCPQNIFCVRDYVAVSRCFCHGVGNNNRDSINKFLLYLEKGFMLMRVHCIKNKSLSLINYFVDLELGIKCSAYFINDLTFTWEVNIKE